MTDSKINDVTMTHSKHRHQQNSTTKNNVGVAASIDMNENAQTAVTDINTTADQ